MRVRFGNIVLSGSAWTAQFCLILCYPGGQPLPRRRPQRRHPRLVMRGTDMLDIPRPPPRRVHDLHRRRPLGADARSFHGIRVIFAQPCCVVPYRYFSVVC